MFHHIYGQLQGKSSFGKFWAKSWDSVRPPPWLGQNPNFCQYVFFKAPINEFKLTLHLIFLDAYCISRWSVADMTETFCSSHFSGGENVEQRVGWGPGSLVGNREGRPLIHTKSSCYCPYILKANKLVVNAFVN